MSLNTNDAVSIAPGIYLVHNRTGFDQAVEAEFSNEYGSWEFMARFMRDRPTEYPALVSLSAGYRGDTCIECNFVSVDILKSALR